MRILVLGGSQFIGRAIVEALVDEHEVSVLNRGTRPIPDSRVDQLNGDRNERRQIASALTVGYDVVVDVSGTERGQIESVLAALPGLAGTRYVFISSAAVYNRDRATPPFKEGDPDDGDTMWGGYGKAKAACEGALRTVDLGALTILRPPYVYGPRNYEQREQFLWARMMTGQPVFVPGTGDTRIQFCHVHALARVVAAACSGTLAPGVYNVGERRDYTFDEYLAILGEVAGCTPRLVYVSDESVPPRDYFPFRKVDFTLDVSRLTRARVSTDTDLTAGLAETLAWFRRSGVIVNEPTPQELVWRAKS